MKTLGLILAAGCSSRLGQNKQFICIDNETLIRRTVRYALESDCSQVVVVTGFEHDRLEAEISDLASNIVYNKHWEKGIGTSIACGIHFALLQTPAPEAVLVLLPDQFAVRQNHLHSLIVRAQKSKKTIIATGYQQTYGPPVVFKRPHFRALTELSDSDGAKTIINKNQENLEMILCHTASYDVDTPSDLAKITSI